MEAAAGRRAPGLAAGATAAHLYLRLRAANPAPFAGSAAVLFAKEPTEVDVINDADPEIVEAYRLIKRLKPEQVARLNDMVVGLVERIIDVYAEIGADGIFTCEDWGTQDMLLMSPEMWRKLFLLDLEALHAEEP